MVQRQLILTYLNSKLAQFRFLPYKSLKVTHGLVKIILETKLNWLILFLKRTQKMTPKITFLFLKQRKTGNNFLDKLLALDPSSAFVMENTKLRTIFERYLRTCVPYLNTLRIIQCYTLRFKRKSAVYERFWRENLLKIHFAHFHTFLKKMSDMSFFSANFLINLFN